MEQVTIWYFTDNEHGRKISDAIKTLGLSINIVQGSDLAQAYIDEDEINITIFDIDSIPPDKTIKSISLSNKLNKFPKYIFVPKKEITEILKQSYNMLHLEFIAKPVDKREFLLLLEKAIIVERYREMMRIMSKESESRIEAYEGIININRKNIFESDKEKLAFEKILSHEKNLLREQAKLNHAIKEFTLLRQSEYFDLQNRVKAEEMLSNLRRKELIDAKNIIDAQESVLDFSAHELDECIKIINATENVAELSRSEAIELHQRLKNQLDKNEKLACEIEQLRKELHEFKQK